MFASLNQTKQFIVMAKNNLSKTTEVATKKTTKKVAEKTFKGTQIPYFDVIIPESISDSGLHLWGIGETKDIGILTHLNDDYKGVNRDVKHPHKGVVGNTILKNGYACGIAVCIYNNKLYGADGNHRAYSLADNGHPIRFAYRKCETLQELVDIMIGFNNSAKNWGINDYISTHATMGSEAYVILQKQIIAHKLTSSVTASLVGNISIGLAKKQIRSGELICDNEKAATDRIVFFKRFLNDIGYLDQRPAEGLLYFLGSISFMEFKAISGKLGAEALRLIDKGALIGKGTPNARAYEKVFNDAYRNIK
jgi:hypothetical protein